MKKKLSLFLALSITAGMLCSIPASAETVIYTEGASIIVAETHRYRAVLAETDGTVLTEELLSDVEGIYYIESYEDFLITAPLHWMETSVTPSENAYVVWTESSVPDLAAFGRSLMLTCDAITEAYTFTATDYCGGAWCDYWFDAETAIPPSEVDITAIPELSEFSTYCNDERNLLSFFVLDNTVPSAFAAIANSENEAEKYLFALDYADMLMEKYSDLFVSVQPSISWPEGADSSEGMATTVWENAGDSNSDGKTNAQDASQILMHAALAGAAVEGDVTISETNADVNADGLVNAKDAACVLIYAAAESAGLDLTWADVLRS